MYTSTALADLHARTHQSLLRLVAHCAEFSENEQRRELDGFGYSSIRMQLHHVVGAEQYWLGVIHGKILVDELEADYASVDALHAFRERVAAETVEYLSSADEAELNTPRKMITWGNVERELVPAQIILRTQTHIFQHQGQVAAMCRLLGRPIPTGLDFPLT